MFIIILCLMAVIGQFIIIYCIISGKDYSALFGVSIDAFTVWPINKLWQINKDFMAVTMAINMIEKADSPSAYRDAMDLAKRVIDRLLKRE